jgi:hypothetical protein
MSHSPATNGHSPGLSVGLSVGATNLAGTRDGHTAVVRPSELNLQGVRLTGFVDRVGDPVPLVAPDGSKHQSERLLAEALGAMMQSVTEGLPVADMAITVPAHWRPSVVDTLRRSLRNGTPVVSDATAAMTALRASPGLPTHGVIALCDFGGSGTSITLADATANYARIGDTIRFPDFSGDQIDQALLTYVFGGIADASQADPSGTAMVGSLARLRDECRRAKERLSAETATAVVADLPGHRSDIRVIRTELEDLIRAPLADFLAALDDTLERYGIAPASVSAVATVGGGARIPLVTQRLSEHLRAPVVTTAHPQLTAAKGAVLIARRGRVTETPTTLTPAPGVAAPTAAIAAVEPSTAFRALAWSEDEVTEDVLPYADDDEPTEYYERPAASRPELHFRQDEWQDEQPARRGPLVLFGLSAAAAAIAAGVFGFTLLNDTTTGPVVAATTSTSSSAPAASAPPPAPPAPQAPEVTTVTVTPAQRSSSAPQRQQPVTEQPPTTPQPGTTAPTPPPWTPPKWTPPTWTPPWKLPTPPPIDPGTANGGTGTGTPPVDQGTGGSGTGTGGTTTAPKA